MLMSSWTGCQSLLYSTKVEVGFPVPFQFNLQCIHGGGVRGHEAKVGEVEQKHKDEVSCCIYNTCKAAQFLSTQKHEHCRTVRDRKAGLLF